MFGIYRLFLAALVVLSHTNLNIPGFYSGVWAVVNFFIISGYVMTAVIQNNFENIIGDSYGRVNLRLFFIDAMRFIIDRSLRILPLFLLVININLAVYFFFTWPVYLSALTWKSYILNIILIPNNYRLIIPGQENSPIIPQSTTLALEEQFFWIFPFLIKFIKLRVIMVFLSVFIFILALTYFPSTYGMYWGYGYLPGVLFMFLVGSSIRLVQTRQTNKKANKNTLQVIMFAMFLLFLYLLWRGKLFAPYVFERVTGILIGPVLIWILSTLKRRKLDDVLGSISYGVFLNHFVLISLFDKYLILNGYTVLKSISILFLSIVYASVTYYFFEKKIQEFRLSTRESIKLFFYSRFSLPVLPENSSPQEISRDFVSDKI